ncbi:hypothetical protein ICN84_07860 [Akkermansia glycaniphila]|uniref:hypothetical protein n=1 Tax=Akkermansia glycaniphila TaxID=1679444 RepID=UPI001C00F087|nr:hypothetical protein [Akkermansia glycaniphila]MBT9449988.1 hypothetical protein [Akkermansia glycaniphila]
MNQISKDHLDKAKTAKGWRKIVLIIGAVVTAGVGAVWYAVTDTAPTPEPPATEQPATAE